MKTLLHLCAQLLVSLQDFQRLPWHLQYHLAVELYNDLSPTLIRELMVLYDEELDYLSSCMMFYELEEPIAPHLFWKSDEWYKVALGQHLKVVYS